MNGDTLLHRQIHPSWVLPGHVSSQAFKPFPKDRKCLSVHNGDMITAEDAWRYYTDELGFTSIGVLAVSCDDCADRDLPVEPDPNPHPAHVVIDFTACSNTQVEKKAKQLTAIAMKRGWQYKADAAP